MNDMDVAVKAAGFRSVLPQGRQRFLAHMVEHAFEIGRRSAADFIRHFPPDAIMGGLEHQAGLRAQILVLTTGLKQKIALKKTWRSAAEDLQIALDEGETDADSVVAVFKPDDRIRFLDAKKIWAFLIEGEFWSSSPSKRAEHERAKAHVAFALQRALDDGLVTHADVVEGISVTELASRLPKAELGKIIEGALQSGRKNAAFTEVDLLGAAPPEVIVDYVPLGHIWNKLVVPKIAEAHGYASSESDAVARPSTPPDNEEWVDAPGADEEVKSGELLLSEEDIRID